VLQDSTAEGTASRYVYGLNLIESVDLDSNDFYQYDGLGNVIQLTDAAGRPEVSYIYDAWGNSVLPEPSTNAFRFTGQALDSANGLYYFRARYYDPSLGRFIDKDPLATLNRYSYALNNPALRIDPSGLFSFANVLGAIGNSTDVAESGLFLSAVTYAQGITELSGAVADTLGGPAVGIASTKVNNYLGSLQRKRLVFPSV
jgi:RHS repeat-associated protein